LLPVDAFPQPGYVVACPAATGHCGILDYDGAWISAWTENVNRNANLNLPNYQPVRMRTFIGN
jgi:hypothetical protein